jgi:hypothetical protein
MLLLHSISKLQILVICQIEKLLMLDSMLATTIKKIPLSILRNIQESYRTKDGKNNCWADHHDNFDFGVRWVLSALSKLLRGERVQN